MRIAGPTLTLRDPTAAAAEGGAASAKATRASALSAHSAHLTLSALRPLPPAVSARPWTLLADGAAEQAAAARAAAWDGVRELLAIRLDSLGDVLMTTPALRAIKASRPHTRITLLTSPAGAAAAPLLPLVDEVIVAPVAWMRGARVGGRDEIGAPERALIDTLLRRRFDAAIVFTVHTQSALPAALLATLAGIPLRLAHARENPYGLLSDWVREPEPHAIQRHEVQRQCALVEHVGYRAASVEDERLCLEVSPEARQAMRQRLRAADIDPARPYIVIHPGASAASRRWPPAHFARAADLLAWDHPIVLAGGAAEAPLLDEIVSVMRRPALRLEADLDLARFAALVADARLVICNNSAPAHIAAAVGTPVVVLYALTNPQHTPWRVPARVLYRDVPCRNCLKSECPLGHHECLLGVRPAQVAAAARELVAATAGLRAGTRSPASPFDARERAAPPCPSGTETGGAGVAAARSAPRAAAASQGESAAPPVTRRTEDPALP